MMMSFSLGLGLVLWLQKVVKKKSNQVIFRQRPEMKMKMKMNFNCLQRSQMNLNNTTTLKLKLLHWVQLTTQYGQAFFQEAEKLILGGNKGRLPISKQNSKSTRDKVFKIWFYHVVQI